MLAVIAKNRKELPPEKIRSLADGRIYTAQQALELKLIDQIGYLDETIAQAKKDAGNRRSAGCRISWKLVQKHPHRVIIMFDDEEAAQIQADKLASRLSIFNIESEAWRISDGRDPSDLTDEEVKEIISSF